jgi:hypothetical protein
MYRKSFVGSDFHVRERSDTIALVTYKSTSQAERPGTDRRSLRASIWRRNGNSWQVVLHQGTPAQYLKAHLT